MKKFSIFLAALLILSLLCTACASSENQEITEPEGLRTTLDLADSFYQAGDYSRSLDLYLVAMEQDIRNMDARLGVVKCQIAQKNYELAEINLSMARQTNPGFPGLCDAYVLMSHATQDIMYAQEAIDLACKYNHTAFLESMPQTPSIDLEAGYYSNRMQVNISCQDPDAQIYINFHNTQNSAYSFYGMEYTTPITLLQGENYLSVYSIKNGIPSHMETRLYTISYDPEEITFQDPLMEELTRVTLGKPEGPITNHECETITDLSWYALRDHYSTESAYQKQKLHTLEDLQYFPALQHLSLENQNKITDFSPLANCPALYYLELEKCDLTDSEFAKYTPNISFLCLYFNNISDFSGLTNLKNLQMLSVSNDNSKAKLDQVLQSCPKITWLAIDDTALENYSVLWQLPELIELTFYGYTKVDYSALGNLTQLEYLNLLLSNHRSDYGKSVGDISFLPRLQNLKSTNWHGVNKASDLVYFMQLPNLQQLVLYNSNAVNDEAAMDALIQALPNCQIIY